MRKVKDILRVILTPSCWTQHRPYSHALDITLKIAIDNGEKFSIEPNDMFYYGKFAGLNLWVANHPYASMAFNDRRPSRITILKLGDLLNEQYTELITEISNDTQS